jgi:hypothetical protein
MKLTSGVALFAAASAFSAVTAAPAVAPDVALAARSDAALEERTLWGLGSGWCINLLGLLR